MKTNAKDIVNFIALNHDLKTDFELIGASSIFEPSENTITYIYINKPELLNKLKTLSNEILVLVPNEFKNYCNNYTQSFIFSSNAKKDFIAIMKRFFVEKRKDTTLVHSTAIIDKNASIHPSVKIGAYSIIEKCTLSII